MELYESFFGDDPTPLTGTSLKRILNWKVQKESLKDKQAGELQPICFCSFLKRIRYYTSEAKPLVVLLCLLLWHFYQWSTNPPQHWLFDHHRYTCRAVRIAETLVGDDSLPASDHAEMESIYRWRELCNGGRISSHRQTTSDRLYSLRQHSCLTATRIGNYRLPVLKGSQAISTGLLKRCTF